MCCQRPNLRATGSKNKEARATGMLGQKLNRVTWQTGKTGARHWDLFNQGDKQDTGGANQGGTDNHSGGKRTQRGSVSEIQLEKIRKYKQETLNLHISKVSTAKSITREVTWIPLNETPFCLSSFFPVVIQCIYIQLVSFCIVFSYWSWQGPPFFCSRGLH